jgi:hypothetical protein
MYVCKSLVFLYVIKNICELLNNDQNIVKEKNTIKRLYDIWFKKSTMDKFFLKNPFLGYTVF